MLGAIIGNTVGSVYEFQNIKTTDFDLIMDDNNYTDDSVMTFAVSDWLLNDKRLTHKVLTDTFVWFAFKYPLPLGGYGKRFYDRLFDPIIECVNNVQEDRTVKHIINEIREPYNSWGNDSAMRISAVGWMFDTLEETERVAEIKASLTHNYSEGIKCAKDTSAAIFLARTGKTKEEIRQYIETKYGYDLSRTCSQIRQTTILISRVKEQYLLP